MSGDAPGEIITFYSFKGGTGRSMALANVAWILASNGHRVLVLDWDLESPGLVRYFHPFLVDQSLQTSRGVIDLVWDFSTAAMDLGHDDDPGWVADQAEIERYAVSLNWDFAGDGTVDFVPAGRQSGVYAGRVSSIDWGTLHERQGSGEFFAQLRENMRRNYDYVLIDSRTGLSDTAGICTLALPDTVVNCFTMNGQSIEGAVETSTVIRRRASRPIRILPVPMRIEDAEQGKLEAGRDYVQRVFTPFLDHLDAPGRDRYWGEIEVPYKPFYAYEEILATIGDRPLQEGSLLASYERLTAALTGGRTSRLVALEEPDRRRWLEEFERTAQPVVPDIFISHVEQDRMWADWIAHQLTSVGYEVVRQGAAFPPGADLGTELRRAVGAASCTLAVMSPDYLESQSAKITWDAALSRDRTGTQGLLVPVQVAQFRPWGRFSSRIPVDMYRLEAEEAVDELLAAVRDPGLKPSGERRTDEGPRFPGSQPLVADLPLRNPHFVGRDSELLKLRQRLLNSTDAVVVPQSSGGTAMASQSGGGGAAVPQAVHGLGGVGKTQLVLEYAHRYSADYDVVWWVPAAQPSEARAKLAALAPLLGGAEADADDDDADVGNTGQQVRAALTALRRGDPYRHWLVVFDNAEDPGELAALLPTGPGHVVLTSRNQDWSSGRAETVEIDVFSRAESIELLQRRGRQMSVTDADRLADRLGDLPLALEQAAVWQAETGMPVEEYLRLFDEHERRNQLLDQGQPDSYPASVAASWSIVFDRLRSDAPASLQLLELCAFFGPEPIPFRFLKFGGQVGLPEPLATALSDSVLRRRAVREIGRYALARIDPKPDTVQVHRLVQAVLRAGVGADQRRSYEDSVHALMALANPGSPDTRVSWPQQAELSAHVVPTGVVDAADAEPRKVVLDQIRYRYRRGDIEGSRDLAELARDRWITLIGHDHEQTLIASRYLADSLRWLGRYDRARALNEDTVRRLRDTVGAEHEHTLATWNSFGADLRVLGRFEDARALDEQNLARHRRVYRREDAPETLRCANNLGVDLRLLGRFQEAYELDDDTLRRSLRVLDAKDPYLLNTTINLARDALFRGEFKDARRMIESVLDDFRGVLPVDHVEMLSAARAYASTLRMAGDLTAARTAAEDNLARHQDQFGPAHQLTVDSMITAGNARRAAGDVAGGRQALEAALAGSRALFTDDHFLTQAAAVNLAVVERLVPEERSAAAARTERALGIFGRLLGAEHYFTVITMANHASDHALAGDHASALRLSEQVAGIARRTWGRRHPDTLGYLVNLSIDRRAAGAPGGRELWEETVDLLSEVLGADHPVTVDATTGRRAQFDIEPPAI